VAAAGSLALAAEVGIFGPSRLMRFLQTLFACAALLYVVYLAGLYFAQRSMSYPGARIRVSPEPAPAPGLERSVLKTPLGDVETLFLPADPSPVGKPEPAVVFGHGNGEVVDYWVNELDGFRNRGIGVLLVEYPGYGRSSGSTSEASIRAAMSAAYDQLASDPRVDRSRIVGFGQSLGGGAVCLLARDRPLRALILQSTFPSAAIFASRFLAPPFLLRDRFDNEAALRQFPGPVLVIHGRADTLIPWQQGRRLASASSRATFRLYDCGHGCWDPDHLPFWRDVDSLLSAAGVR
jgi:pimeloyl-ACP methyl ester carboxylesterase